jgi:hypothetical protein
MEMVSRVGICLSRCSLRVNALPQCVQKILPVVVVAGAGGIVLTGSVTRLRPSTSSGLASGASGRWTVVWDPGLLLTQEDVADELERGTGVSWTAPCKRKADVKSSRRVCGAVVI